MELQHIIWSWETITQRLLDVGPDLGRALFRSCRPIAAQRYRDGRLLIVLGCWWTADQQYLARDVNHARLNDSLGKMLSEQVTTTIVRWPGGVARIQPAAEDEEQIPAPDILQGVPADAREEAAKCESAIQRLFYARAYVNPSIDGRLKCQYPMLHYRLDFAIPEKRVAAEVLGWDWRTGPTGARERREREEQLELQGWRVLLFSGSQVLSHPDKCVADLVELTRSQFTPGQRPLPTRYSPEPRKPFSSIGIHRPMDRRPGRRK